MSSVTSSSSAQSQWQADVNGTGTSGDKLASDGKAFEQQLQQQISQDQQSGDTQGETTAQNELTAVTNATNSLSDGTYSQQGTQSAFNAASSGNGAVNSDSVNLGVIEAENKSELGSGNTTQLQNNLASFIQQETADGHGNLAAVAQEELKNLQAGGADPTGSLVDSLNAIYAGAAQADGVPDNTGNVSGSSSATASSAATSSPIQEIGPNAGSSVSFLPDMNTADFDKTTE